MQCQERLIARPLLPASIRRNVRQFLNLPARKLISQFLHLILCARLLLFSFVVCRGISTVNVLSRRGRKELNRNWERCHDRHNGFTLHISLYSCMRRKRMKQPAAVGLFNIFFYGPIWSNDIDTCCGMSELPSWPFLDQPLCELTFKMFIHKEVDPRMVRKGVLTCCSIYRCHCSKFWMYWLRGLLDEL